MGTRIYSIIYLILIVISVQRVSGQVAMPKYILKKGDVAVLRVNTAQPGEFLWYKNDVLITGEKMAVLSVKDIGIYKVVAENSTGCPSPPTVIEIVGEESFPADVNIVKRSEAREILVDQVFSYFLVARNNGSSKATGLEITDQLPDELIFESLASPTNGSAVYDAALRRVKWQIQAMPVAHFAELEIKVRTKRYGFISNTATISAIQYDPNLSNNTSTDNKQINALHVHNVFTPNGDGKNDSFFIENLNSFESNELTIINRFGSTVYRESNYRNNWDGSGLSDATYFYVVSVRNGTSPWIELKGYVTLIR